MATIGRFAVLGHTPMLMQLVGFLVAGLLAAAVVVVSPVLALGLVLGLIAGLFFLVRPVETLVVALVARVFVDILWWVPFTVGGLNLSQIFSGVTFVMLCVITLLRARTLRDCPVAAWSIAMVALLLLSAARAVDLLGDIELLIRYMMAPLMVLAISVVFRDATTRRRLIKYLSIAALVPIGYSMFAFATGADEYALDGYERLLGGYKNIHNHALVMMVFSMLFLSWARSAKRNWVRVGAWTIVGTSLACIYFTYTRTGLLGWVLSVFTVLIVLKRWRLLSIVCAVGAVVVLMNPDIQDRFSDLVDVFDPSVRSVDRRSLGSGRWGLWSWSMHTYLARPIADVLVGLGLGGFRLTTLSWSQAFSRMGLTLDPHNDCLLLLYQTGPLGVIAYLGMLWKTFTSSLYVSRHGPDSWSRAFGVSVAGLCAGVLLTNAVSNSFVHRSAPGWYFWVLAGVVVAEFMDVRAQQRARLLARRRPQAVPPQEPV